MNSLIIASSQKTYNGYAFGDITEIVLEIFQNKTVYAQELIIGSSVVIITTFSTNDLEDFDEFENEISRLLNQSNPDRDFDDTYGFFRLNSDTRKKADLIIKNSYKNR